MSSNAVLFHQGLLGTDKHSTDAHIVRKTLTFFFTRRTVSAGQAKTPTDLGEVELKRIISGQGDYEASGQILRQGVAVVAKKQAVVAKR